MRNTPRNSQERLSTPNKTNHPYAYPPRSAIPATTQNKQYRLPDSTNCKQLHHTTNATPTQPISAAKEGHGQDPTVVHNDTAPKPTANQPLQKLVANTTAVATQAARKQQLQSES